MTEGATVALLSPALGTENIGDHFIELAIRRLLRPGVAYPRFSTRRTLREAEIAAINACDVAVVCGTNLYQHEWESALTPDVLERIDVSVVPFGVGSSAGSLDSQGVGETTRRMIRLLHDRCAVGSVRDPHSARVVTKTGVHNVLLTGCPVLYWAQEDRLPPVAQLPRRRLIVAPRNWLMHVWPEAVDNPVQVNLIANVLSAFPDVEVVLAIHEPFDVSLADALGIPPHRRFHSAEPEDYVQLYTDPENVVLAMRLHAGMLALANGVPAVFVGHDTRTYSFCSMIGLDYVELFDADASERCIQMLRSVFDANLASFTTPEARFVELRGEMWSFMERNGLPAREEPR